MFTNEKALLALWLYVIGKLRNKHIAHKPEKLLFNLQNDTVLTNDMPGLKVPCKMMRDA